MWGSRWNLGCPAFYSSIANYSDKDGHNDNDRRTNMGIYNRCGRVMGLGHSDDYHPHGSDGAAGASGHDIEQEKSSSERDIHLDKRLSHAGD